MNVSPKNRRNLETKHLSLAAIVALAVLLASGPVRVLAEDAPAATPPAAAQPQATEAVAAPPPTTPSPAAAAKPAEAKASDDGYRTSGLIPGVLLGPKVGAALLFPPNLMVGAEVRVIGYIGASFEYGVYPQNVTIQGFSGTFKSWSAGLRAYPFRGAFFVGLVLGNYDVTVSNTIQEAGLSQTTTLNVKSTYLGPQIGWKWTWDFGLFLGLNLGYGFSLDYSSSFSSDNLASSDLDTIKSNADKYLKTGIPILTLLEIGFLF